MISNLAATPCCDHSFDAAGGCRRLGKSGPARQPLQPAAFWRRLSCLPAGRGRRCERCGRRGRRSARRARRIAAFAVSAAGWRRARSGRASSGPRLRRHDADRRRRGGAREFGIGGPAGGHRRPGSASDAASTAAPRRRVPGRRVARDQVFIDALVHVGGDLMIVGQRAERAAGRGVQWSRAIST